MLLPGRGCSGHRLALPPCTDEEWHGEGEAGIVEEMQESRDVSAGDQAGIDGLVSGLQQVRAQDGGSRAGAGSEDEATFGAGPAEASALQLPWKRRRIPRGVHTATRKQFAERAENAVERALFVGHRLGAGREDLMELFEHEPTAGRERRD